MKCKKVAALVVVIVGATSRAEADPLRLRGDALVEVRAPAGLLVLQGEHSAQPWVQAEGLVWTGAGTTVSRDRVSSEPTAEVLVMAVRLREPHGIGEVRGGRFVFATGAIRPRIIDGIEGRARAPWGSSVELALGAPVVPRFGERPYDVVVGGRLSQTIASRVTFGGSYVQERTHGELAREETGLDLGAIASKSVDLAGRVSYDLSSPGVSEALASTSLRGKDLRFEIFATHRSPSRLLPATSLFSVLGDYPSETAGLTTRWLAAPRLDVVATGAARTSTGEVGGTGTVRSDLRLDDRGDGRIGAELRREHVADARWTGVRALGTVPLGMHIHAATELELVAADEPRGRGAVWPWALVALGWRHVGWELAGAVEAASTPLHVFETNALVRLSRTMEIR